MCLAFGANLQNDNVNGHRDHTLPHHPAFSQLAIYDDARFINTFGQLIVEL